MSPFVMNNFLRVFLLSAICQKVINVKFKIELNRKIAGNENTTDIYQKTLVGCTWLCFHDKKCASASFNMETSTCRLDSTDQCCVATEKSDTWNLIRNCLYNRITCDGCFTYEASLYKVIDDPKNWTNAVEECKCRGGFLAEIESAEENNFIKNIAKERFAVTGEIYYWLGAYNFDNDSNMEWIRNPSKPMPFTDWYAGEPNKLRYEFCLALYQPVDYLWIDFECPEATSFICEFNQN